MSSQHDKAVEEKMTRALNIAYAAWRMAKFPMDSDFFLSCLSTLAVKIFDKIEDK